MFCFNLTHGTICINVYKYQIKCGLHDLFFIRLFFHWPDVNYIEPRTKIVVPPKKCLRPQRLLKMDAPPSSSKSLEMLKLTVYSPFFNFKYNSSFMDLNSQSMISLSFLFSICYSVNIYKAKETIVVLSAKFLTINISSPPLPYFVNACQITSAKFLIQ